MVSSTRSWSRLALRAGLPIIASVLVSLVIATRGIGGFVFDLPLFHIYGMMILLLAILAIYVEWRVYGFRLYSFSLVGSIFFIWGTLGPYIGNYLLDNSKQYAHFDIHFFEPAMLFALLCFTSLWLGYLLPIFKFPNRSTPVLTLDISESNSLVSLFWLLFIIWVLAAIIYSGGVEKFFYSDTARMFDQFDISPLRKNTILVFRIFGPLLAVLAVILFNVSGKHRLSIPSLLVLAWSFVFVLSQFDRGRYIEVVAATAFSYLIVHRPNMRNSISVLLGLLSTVIIVVINANGRLYGKTGLLNIPEAVSYGIARRGEQAYSLIGEVGALSMTTTVMRLHDAGYKFPTQNIIYQINPMPSFLLPSWLLPQRYMEEVLGTFGYSGVPLPLMAISYFAFGVFGCLTFFFVGIWMRFLYRWLVVSSDGLPGIPIGPILLYVVSLAGLFLTFSHGEPRGSIRYIIYSTLFLILLKSFSPNVVMVSRADDEESVYPSRLFWQ